MRLVDLPRVALILALGLAVPGAGARAVAREARGLLVRAAVRWPSGDVLLADRAALLCTRGDRERWSRAAAGLALGVLVGLILEVPVALAVSLLLWGLTRLLPLAHPNLDEVVLVVALLRALASLRPALAARRDGGATAQRDDPGAWWVDALAAFPTGQGHGGRILDRLLAAADAADVPVLLRCTSERVAFYRAHGFHRHGHSHGLVLLRRVPRPRGPAAALDVSVLGESASRDHPRAAARC